MSHVDDRPARADLGQQPCAYHPDEVALARCARCDQQVCHRCHGHDLRGFLICKNCRRELVGLTGVPWESPSDAPLSAFLSTLWLALRSPRAFYAPMPQHSRWLPAVAFGLSCITAGSLVSTLWELALGQRLVQRLIELAPQTQAPLPALKAMALARAPLMAPLIMAFHTLTLHAALRLGGVPADRVTVARIFGFACAGYVWMLLPPIMGLPLGQILAMVWLFNLEAAGIQHFYGVHPVKATLIALAPLLLGVSLQCI